MNLYRLFYSYYFKFYHTDNKYHYVLFLLKLTEDESKPATNLQKLGAATSYIAKHVQFGSLDVCVQRMATIIED